MYCCMLRTSLERRRGAAAGAVADRLRLARGAVVVHHLPRLHGGLPGVRRAHRQHRGHAPLPGDGAG